MGDPMHAARFLSKWADGLASNANRKSNTKRKSTPSYPYPQFLSEPLKKSGTAFLLIFNATFMFLTRGFV